MAITSKSAGAYSRLSNVLARHWEDQEGAAFCTALEELRKLALSGDGNACEAIAEVYALPGFHHDAAASYKWYYVAFLNQGYSVNYENLHPDPGYYCGPVGDFRNEGIVSGLIDELGLERIQQLDVEANQLVVLGSN